MDDGSNAKSGVMISTLCFTKEEVQFMADVLKTKYDLNCTVRKDNGLYIKADSMSKLNNLIERYFPESMLYKLVRKKFGELRGTPVMDNPDPSVVNDKEVTTKEQRLTSEESTNNLDTSAEQPKGIEPHTYKVLRNWLMI